ncbi:hypothetical protein AZH53_08345 [Methanomicrobiaceae archaeon CYW5]|uniref:DUF5518 domain-containing protein n=1 Tax=Methanovulcanius yangii TaxID=1789227 RepID=UPI0029CA0661|nr:DUF5518 domain-containing protein [Methanovulcanius yangii]MBT8508412.1 hypothetical protein [Methanovulcanius yangii]
MQVIPPIVTGFLLIVILSIAFPAYTLLWGVIGGIVAGAMVPGDWYDGVKVGLLTGIIAAAVFGFIVLVGGTLVLGVLGFVIGLGTTFVLLILSVFDILMAAAGGALGGEMGYRYRAWRRKT